MYRTNNNNRHYFLLLVSIISGTSLRLISAQERDYSSSSLSMWSDWETANGSTFLDTWEAPYEIRSQYPYYLAGHDYENRPVWIVEVGKWNYRKMVERGEEALAIFDMYIKQAIYRMTRSFQNLGTPDDPVTGITMISDMDEFSFIQMAHVPTVAYLLRSMRTYRDWFIKHLDLAISLNTNAVAQSLINLARPVLGRVMERVEVYGTQRSRWISRILKHIPPSQLPPWYGGRPNFKPIKVYG